MRKMPGYSIIMFSRTWRGESRRLVTLQANRPLAPFTYRGIIIDNADCDPDSWNNHGSIECFNGQWYVFTTAPAGDRELPKAVRRADHDQPGREHR